MKQYQASEKFVKQGTMLFHKYGNCFNNLVLLILEISENSFQLYQIYKTNYRKEIENELQKGEREREKKEAS